eukprot:CAMPEP_0119314826 /NCGR_PEP_ID=MMETSP1333-20130426/34050_1 /TAXON_ID=418940 /ORGANISM="Scyphosphaera apsteinii, Strain RCC1455" /LENGTH=371 /DNA_ID=CAMNT_0007320025 /DNA_START=64 /DNA_END=1179 /DNA_ORIENTATION=+
MPTHQVGSWTLDADVVGSGAFGAVYKATNESTGELAACKYVSHRKMRVSAIQHEVQFMARAKHAHVIQLKDCIQQEEESFIFMELASHGELFSRVISNGSLDEREARGFFRQIMLAVEYLHSQGIVHRDLKLENVLLNDADECKVCDFGLAHLYDTDDAQKLKRPLLHEVCGSKSYAAPEVLNGHGYDGFAADVWSCGICLFAMLAGFFPLDGATTSDWRFTKVSEAVLRGRSLTHTVFGFYNRPCVLSDEVADLIDGMLSLNPSTRLTVSDILEHPWLTSQPAPILRNDTDSFNAAPRYRSITFTESSSLGLGMQMSVSRDMQAMLSDDSAGMPLYRGVALGAAAVGGDSSKQPPALQRQHAFGLHDDTR